MVEKWISEFKRSRTSTSDAKLSGRPKDVPTPDIIEKIHDIVFGKMKKQSTATISVHY